MNFMHIPMIFSLNPMKSQWGPFLLANSHHIGDVGFTISVSQGAKTKGSPSTLPPPGHQGSLQQMAR